MYYLHYLFILRFTLQSFFFLLHALHPTLQLVLRYSISYEKTSARISSFVFQSLYCSHPFFNCQYLCIIFPSCVYNIYLKSQLTSQPIQKRRYHKVPSFHHLLKSHDLINGFICRECCLNDKSPPILWCPFQYDTLGVAVYQFV